MKNIYAHKTVIYISFLGLILFAIAIIVCVISMFSGIRSGQSNIMIAYMFLTLGFLAFFVLFAFILNRLGCKVTYDQDKKIICRKGFFCGYNYQIKVEDIREIIIVMFPKETTYFVLVDSFNTKYDGESKKSFIRIEKTEENLDFIKQFWDKPIKECIEYSDLFKYSRTS